MKRNLIGLACVFLFALSGQIANAAVINGQFVPDALVGSMQTYRLIFVTAGSVAPVDNVLGVLQAGDYDAFVNQEALQSDLLDSGFDYGWKAVVTVMHDPATVDFQNAAGVLAGDAPVYNLSEVLVAATGDIMAGGTVAQPVKYDQYGEDAGFTLVWTGGMRVDLGPVSPGGEQTYLMPDYYLGVNTETTSAVGRSWTNTGDNWIDALNMERGTSGEPMGFAVYAISGELTAVPEPATVVLWSMCAGIVGLVAWRKRYGK